MFYNLTAAAVATVAAAAVLVAVVKAIDAADAADAIFGAIDVAAAAVTLSFLFPFSLF